MEVGIMVDNDVPIATWMIQELASVGLVAVPKQSRDQDHAPANTEQACKDTRDESDRYEKNDHGVVSLVTGWLRLARL